MVVFGDRCLSGNYRRPGPVLLSPLPFQRIPRGAAVVGFRYEHTNHPYWKYRVTRRYRHVCTYPMDHAQRGWIGLFFRPIADDNAVVLDVGYTWNGSNVVVDTKSDMLASAIHDAHCQGMAQGAYHQSLKNWRMAASEYRHNCIQHGMPRWRAWTRYLGILIGGGNGYKWRGSLKNEQEKSE